MNSNKIILHLCADIGSDSKPYKDAGYDVRCVGRLDGGIENFEPPENVYGIIANPPCTHFSIARSSTAATPRNLMEGMRLVKECLRVIWICSARTTGNNIKSNLNFWVIENPATGALKYFLGKPAYTYCPSEFGAPFTKRTSLWGCFNEPVKPWWNVNKPKGQSYAKDVITKMNCRDDVDRMNLRSKCYEPFAQAFFEVNQ